MKVHEIADLKDIYENIRDNLLQTIKNSQYEIDVAGDIVDKLQGATILRVQNELLKINLQKLKAVQKAIERIKDEGFGGCEACGEFIGIKRLKALPGCTLCISCAEKAEINK